MSSHTKFDWAELLEGVLLIVLGLFTLARPEEALTGAVLLYGTAALVMGVVDIVFYVRIERFTGFGPTVSLISGTLSVMTGVMLLVYPSAGHRVFSLLFPLWFITHCVARLANLNTIRLWIGRGSYYFNLVLNILGLVLGTLMLIDPWFSLLSSRIIIGLYLILLGVDCIILAFSGAGSHTN